jgi:hypothetical protein
VESSPQRWDEMDYLELLEENDPNTEDEVFIIVITIAITIVTTTITFTVTIIPTLLFPYTFT